MACRARVCYHDLFLEARVKKRFIAVVFTLTIVAVQTGLTCTIFNASRKGLVLVGNTEDMPSTDSFIYFMPGEKGKHGIVYVGFERYGVQGAMSDQGLFLDFNALNYPKMNPHPEKPGFGKDQWMFIVAMETCATVEDVIALFTTHNLAGWGCFQVQFVDKTGASVVMGPDKNGELFVVRKAGEYQVSTNFSLANPEFGARSYPCPRYKIANEMLQNMKELSVDYYRSILAAVHAEGEIPTAYANICDLTNGEFYLYNFHNFEEAAKFNVAEELKKGKHFFKMASLFPRKTNAQIRFEETLEQTPARILEDVFNKQGTKATIEKLAQIRSSYSPENGDSQLSAQVSKLVLLMQINGKLNESLEIYAAYAREYPNSAPIQKNLGDLYMKTGKRDEAIRCYETVLKLSPDNAEVRSALDTLRKSPASK